MTERVKLEVSMYLESDAIFGSGCNEPGGADITVCKDAAGWPYLLGSTWKGLLRESLENLLVWTAANPEDLRAQEETAAVLLGEPDWNGLEDGRRLTLTELRIRKENCPPAPEDCYASRAFTRLDRDTGTAASASLRSAECIRRNLVFVGTVVCARQDRELVVQALRGIRWVGTLRSRGFGAVNCVVRELALENAKAALSPGNCIRFRLRLDSAALLTDLSRSGDNHYATRGYLPGSALRGLVLGTLAAERPDWFAAHQRELLSSAVRFLDALPVSGCLPPIPTLQGFYESKDGAKFESIFTADLEKLQAKNMKRARLGAFCTLEPSGEGTLIRYWKAATGGAARIAQSRRTAETGQSGEDTDGLFQTRFLLPGQEFEGYILLDDPSLAETLGEAIPQTGHIGADRFAGFGRFTRIALDTVDAPRWVDAYGYGLEDSPGEKLYLLALSPFAMRDGNGQIRGFDRSFNRNSKEAWAGSPLSRLAEKLGVNALKVEHCATTLTEYGGYNRQWGCRVPAARMYDRGSVFMLRCDRAPCVDALRRVQREGLGIRREEGFGQVLFLRAAYFDGPFIKSALQEAENPSVETSAAIRRKKVVWVMEHVEQVADSPMSASQIGTLRSLCEEARRQGGNAGNVRRWFDSNAGKNVRHSTRFAGVRALTEAVLDRPLSKTLNLSTELAASSPDSMAERLQLLCDLFCFSNRIQEEEGGRI